MKKIHIIYFLPLVLMLSCVKDNNQTVKDDYDIPIRHHNLSYIPFDQKLDNPTFIMCDSTRIASGRNRVRYDGGNDKFRADVIANYTANPEYRSFNGYVVVHFLVNCEGSTGRYRAETLNMDFSPLTSPPGLINYAIELIKNLDNWTRASSGAANAEYSKYINLNINNGEIQHVIL